MSESNNLTISATAKDWSSNKTIYTRICIRFFHCCQTFSRHTAHRSLASISPTLKMNPYVEQCHVCGTKPKITKGFPNLNLWLYGAPETMKLGTGKRLSWCFSYSSYCSCKMDQLLTVNHYSKEPVIIILKRPPAIFQQRPMQLHNYPLRRQTEGFRMECAALCEGALPFAD